MYKILLIIFLSATSSLACVSPATKVNLKGSSLEKYPITIIGNKIYFDKGTSTEVTYQFNQNEKAWCPTLNTSGCLKEAGAGKIFMSGIGTTADLFIANKNKDYAKIEVKENKLFVFAVDLKNKKINNKYLEFKDESTDSKEALVVKSSFGALINIKREKNSRAATPAPAKVLDLSQAISIKGGC